MPREVDWLEFITTNSIVWDDINFSAIALGAGASAPDKVGILGSTALTTYGFDGNVTAEYLYGGGEVLHGYKEGTDLEFHVHWLPTSTATGNVEWNLTYAWINSEPGSATSVTPSTIQIVAETTGTISKQYIHKFSDIDGNDKKIGSQFMFRLYRNPSSTNDTYAADAALLSAGIHYQINSVGSRKSSEK